MIVKMKKISVIVQQKDADSALDKLRSLGSVHVEHERLPQGGDVARLREEVDLVNSAVRVLSLPEYLEELTPQHKEPADWRFVAKHVVELYKRIEQLKEYSQPLISHIQEWERWGDFDPDTIRQLAEKGIYIRLYQIPVRRLSEVPSGLIVEKIFVQSGIAHCAVIAREKIEIPFKEVLLPKMGLGKMRSRLYEDSRLRNAIQDDICSYLIYLDALIKVRRSVEKELEFHEALEGMGQDGAFAYLSGYIPFDAQGELEKTAGKERWGLLIRDPSADDTVPTLLRNPRWVRLIQPVLRLLGILPGYRELDVSLLFLVFFGIFFGILIGDAGYGAVYFALTLWLQKKKGAAGKNKNVFFLAYILSLCAIIWGVATGTFFGQDWLIARNIKPLLPQLNNPLWMQNICFLLGAVHLTIAHAWRALVKFPDQAFLADLGWISVLWVGYFLACTLVLAQPFPVFGLPVGVGGALVVLFFSEPRRNVFKRIGAGFISVTFGLSFVGAFTDVVSYVRLFAVGLAGVAIANTTNAMVSGLGPGLVAFFLGALITIIGHALNIVLGPISVLVHGVRLNVLEFGVNHAGATWSGLDYKPFAREIP